MTRPASGPPDDDVLAAAYRRSLEISISEQKIQEIQEEAHEEAAKAKAPKGLAAKVKKRLKADPAMPWDEAMAMEAERHG